MSKTSAKDFDKLLSAFIDVANRNMGNLEERNSELSKSVAILVTENIELRNDLKQVNKRLQLAEGMIAQQRTKMSMQDEQILDLTARSMRDNIVVQGIPEKPKESWDDTKRALMDFFSEKMKIPNTNDIIIDRAHRSGNKHNGPGAKPRPIIAKLMTQKSKDTIFRNTRSLSGKPEFKIQEQLPTEVIERRKKLWPKYKDAKNNEDNFVKWNLDKLIINGVTYTAYDDYQEINPSLAVESEMDINHTQHDTVDGSTFMGHSAKIASKDEVPIVMANILQDRSLASATHNIYAYRVTKGDGKFDEAYRDDGEHGAGFKLLKYMKDNDIENAIVVVTRWFGNKLLGPKRFDCIVNSADTAVKLLNSD